MCDDELLLLRPGDARSFTQVHDLLNRNGLSLDPTLDFTVGLFRSDGTLVATGSAYRETLRCLAVDPAYQGEGLLNRVLTFLIEEQAARGVFHLFLYTKCETAPLFAQLGFQEIARVPGKLVFMDNRPGSFDVYLETLQAETPNLDGSSAAVIVNCNPFTLGHRALIERAARENACLHVFVVSEDRSLFLYKDRLRLVREGTADLNNLVYHATGQYLISNATFPSYFLRDEETVTKTHAALDVALFARIAGALGITRRYVGSEPFSVITRLYNDVMRAQLPTYGIEYIEMPRVSLEGQGISASDVRQAIHDGRLDSIRPMVPASTRSFLDTPDGLATIRRIREARDVRHA